jgi:predicted Co/Zn/Cd cation transporter (cation efflux family)
MDRAITIGSAVSISMMLAAAVYWHTSKPRPVKPSRDGKLSANTLLTLFLWFVVGLMVSLALLSRNKSSGKPFCVNNAVQHQQSDGISICVVSGALAVYTILATSYAWLLQAADLDFKFFPMSSPDHQRR